MRRGGAENALDSTTGEFRFIRIESVIYGAGKVRTLARELERRALRQRLVELEEVDRLKSQFLSIASHELKTPLTVIAGLVQISERRIARAATREGLPADLRDDAARTRDALGTAHRQTIRLARLIEELLDLSRLETGRIEMRHVALDAVALVHEVAERMRMADPAAVIEIAPSDDQAMVVADQDRLEQVVENLVANALKYSAPGSPVRLCVSVTAGSLDIAVEDHGVGIPHEELTRIFDLFYRSVEARMARPEGLGLGLFISHEIVTRLGGTLTVDSSVGVGSTFHVRLPLAVAHSLEAGDAAPVKDREAATKG